MTSQAANVHWHSFTVIDTKPRSDSDHSVLDTDSVFYFASHASNAARTDSCSLFTIASDVALMKASISRIADDRSSG